jgi:hypothetical protein
MRRLLLAAAGMLAMTAAAPARSCMVLHLPEAVLFDSRPAEVPPGYALLRGKAAVAAGGNHRLLLTLEAAKDRRRLGNPVWVEMERWTSCTDWGPMGRAVWVVARPAGRVGGRTLLRAKAYSRSGWDRFWSWLGLTRYTPAGPSRVD